MIRLLHPEFLWLLALIPVLAILAGKRAATASLLFPNTDIAAVLGKQAIQNPFRWLTRLRLLALALLILAIARPQLGRTQSEISASGIDIILALDISTSMNALDFRLKGREVRRIEAVKTAIEKFVEDRPDDRIALLVFAAKPYLLSPLTLDHEFILDRLYSVDTGTIEDGTAIGTALARSVRQLVDRDVKSRVVILLTDGENTRGRITPMQAAEIAKTLDTKVYTIGAGSRGIAKVMVKDNFGRDVIARQQVRIDEETLQNIASLTGGSYFRATDLNELENVYATIDEMEKTTKTIQGFSVEQEYFPYLLIAGLLVLLLEILLSQTRLLKLP